MNTYSYSLDEEVYEGEYSSHEQAASLAFIEHPHADTAYTALNVYYVPDYLDAAETALEALSDDAWVQCDEHAEDWAPACNDAIVERVANAIKEAIEQLDAPLFYTVTDVQQHWREGCEPY